MIEAMNTASALAPELLASLQAHCVQLADAFPGLRAQDAQQVLNRLALTVRPGFASISDECADATAAMPCPTDYWSRFPFTLLERALVVCRSPQEAVEIIQGVDTADLIRRSLAAEYLFGEQPPLRSLEELAMHLREFVAYLDADRAHLVRTGLPQYPFGSCAWLYHNLARLYDTRRTRSPWPAAVRQFPDRQGAPAYRWFRIARETGSARAPLLFTAHDYQDCPYEEADLLHGLSAADAQRLEDGRDKIFRLKIALLQLLLDAVHRRDACALGKSCLSAVTAELNSDEIAFCFRMDTYYLGRNFGDPPLVRVRRV